MRRHNRTGGQNRRTNGLKNEHILKEHLAFAA